ncbi:hypothetical protein BD626DRAFT_8555 [Schizophyllum amplum]|uniref:Uncharacterized protein n=1 Tax=Schizophyllum amplum TaxID=97359 RepID=A0A550CWU1_9AGAR|nr:hypothetical protein BD626DRAFT_8555 [Auriculariopsis ampla]
MVLTHSRAELIGTVVETMAYGVYFVLFVRCLEVIHTRQVEGKVSLLLLITSLLLFTLITIHMCISTWRNLDAFTGPHTAVMLNAAEIFFAQHVFDHIDRLKNALYVVITWVSDVFLLYRCYMVYERQWLWTMFPVIIFLGDFGFGIYGIFLLCTQEDVPDLIKSQIVDRVKYFYLITMVLNIVCTIMIAAKIAFIQRRTNRAGIADTVRTLNTTVIIIVESAALYSIALVVLIVFAAEHSGGMYTLLQLMPSIIGIVFSLIIVRVGGGRDQVTRAAVSSAKHTATIGSSAMDRFSARRGVITDTTTYEDTVGLPHIPHGPAGGISIALHERTSSSVKDENDLERQRSVEKADISCVHG